jgi:RNA polymerase sigma-70 factor (ECF subfamily)
VALSDIDRNLLDRCLTRKPRAWEDFVDRFMGLVVHVTNHSAQCRSIRLSAEDREDLCAEVFLAMLKDDLAVLRHFRRQSSLATYLTVIARRVVVREMLGRKSASRLSAAAPQTAAVGAGTSDHGASDHSASDRSASDRSASDQHERRVEDREEVARLLEELDGDEAQVVRMYHLEGKSYQEISSAVGMPENSVGPTLSRAREKMRRAGAGPAAS